MILPFVWLSIACFDLGTPPITHDGQVTAVAISPDGERIASTGLYDGLTISDNRGKMLHFVSAKQRGRGFHSVIYSPDGKELFAGTDSQVVVFDATGKQLRAWNAKDRDISGLALSPDGKTLATRGYREKVVRLWDAATGKPEGTLEGHDDAGFPITLRWAGQGRVVLATFSGVTAWNVNKKTVLFALSPSTGGGLDVTPGGEAFVTGGEKSDAHLSLREVRTGDEIRAFKGKGGIPLAYAFSFDGTLMAAGAQSGLVMIFNAETGDELYRRKLEGKVRGLAFSSKENLLAAATTDGKVWLIRPGKLK